MIIDALATIIDLRTDTVVATTHAAVGVTYDKRMNEACPVSFTLTFADNDAATALLAAASQPTLGSTRLPYYVELSLDNGATPFFTTMVMDLQDDITLRQTGLSLFEGYTTRGIDRVTFSKVRFADAVYGAAGTIIPQDFGGLPRELGSGLPLKYAKGYFRTTPGKSTWAGQHRLAYTPVIDPAIADILINSDDNAVYIPDALQTVLAQVAGVELPGDAALPGEHAYWYEDSAKKQIHIGRVGATVKGSFQQHVTSPSNDQAQITAGIVRAARLSTLATTYKPVGGHSNHGLAEGATIDSPVVINTDRGRDSLDWDSNLCLFCATGSGADGVYYWGHDGIAYPVAQSLPGARSLTYFAGTHTLYVASDSGVYTHSANVSDTSQWTRVGGLSAAVARIIVALWQGGGVACNVVAEVKGSGSGGDGLYIYPGLDSNGADYGYAGWSVLSQNAVSVWNYTYPGDTLLTADPNDPATIVALFSSTDTGLSSPLTSRFTTPNGANVTAITTLPPGDDPATITGGNVALTAMGALGMYYLDLRGHWTDLNADLTLVDSAGNAPTVHSVTAYNDYLVVEGVDQFVALVACTDAGPYVSPYLLGGSWRAMGSQSGVANVVFLGIAVGTPQTLIDRVVNRLYGATNQGLMVSHSSGKYWDNETNDPLSLGAYLSDLGNSLGLGVLLPNDVTSIGNLADGGSTGTSGRHVPGPTSGTQAVPADIAWIRVLDERNKWVYGLVHTQTSHPYGRVVFGDIAGAVTDAQTDAKTGSGRLARVGIRTFVSMSTPQLLLEVHSSFVDTDSFLCALDPQDLVTVDCDFRPFYGLVLDGVEMKVLQHAYDKGQADTVINTKTTLGLQLRLADMTGDDFEHGVQYTLSRMHRYGR